MALRGLRYRTVARLLHHFDLHHTRRIGPLEDSDGDWVIGRRCEWCGIAGREYLDPEAKIRRAGHEI